jgi:hypothetical protein
MRYLFLLIFLTALGCLRYDPPKERKLTPEEREALQARAEIRRAEADADWAETEVNRIAAEIDALTDASHRLNASEAWLMLSAEWEKRRETDRAAADQWVLKFVDGKNPEEMTDAVFGQGRFRDNTPPLDWEPTWAVEQ